MKQTKPQNIPLFGDAWMLLIALILLFLHGGSYLIPVQFYSSTLSLTSLPGVDYIVNTRWITAVQSLSHLDKILTMQKTKNL